MSQDRFGLVAVADATGFELTYQIPHDLTGLQVGDFCHAPVRTRGCVGVFLGECEAPGFPCRVLGNPLPFTRGVSPELMALIRWVSSYYLGPIGRSIRLLAPGFLWDPKAAEKRTLRFSKLAQGEGIPVFPSRLRGEPERLGNRQLALLPHQQTCLENILKAHQTVSLLQGVTGSGKTEVYLKAAEQILASGRNVLVLVPEIALTPQMCARFRTFFSDDLAILHSGLTPVEYEREWFRTHWGQARVVLGVRSAVFAPVRNLGLIVVDEEHDGSYKCDDFPCYHARDVAVKRAVLEGARCILGSATPSAESYLNSVQGKYHHEKLTVRYSGNLPEITVIDAKEYLGKTPKKSGSPTRSSLISYQGNIIAPPILDLLQETKAMGKQSMVILNRRGFASYCLCRTCGNALTCPNCAVTTTLHKAGRTEICHYCGFQRPTPEQCPLCMSPALLAMGAGTQNLESELARALPELKVGRLDRDVLTSNSRLKTLLESFRAQELDCLVGTQILAKGHDFPKVTLVAILHVEDGLFLPDFRSGERTFQLLTQAAGRAGRGVDAGRVVIQSLVMGHPVVSLAMEADIDRFLARELEMRRMGWHPPFTRQILFEFSSRDEHAAHDLGENLKSVLISHWTDQGIPPDNVRLSGPYPAVIERLREVFRFQICIAAQKNLLPSRLVPRDLLVRREFRDKVRCDVDPLSFL